MVALRTVAGLTRRGDVFNIVRSTLQERLDVIEIEPLTVVTIGANSERRVQYFLTLFCGYTAPQCVHLPSVSAHRRSVVPFWIGSSPRQLIRRSLPWMFGVVRSITRPYFLWEGLCVRSGVRAGSFGMS